MRYVAPTANDRDQFHQGGNRRAYEMLGAHPVTQDGVPMWHFAVWAPNAKQVSLVGEFCEWKRDACPMKKQYDGIWEIRVPASAFDPASDPKKYDYKDADKKLKNYKFAVQTQSGEWHDRTDPFAFRMEQRPNTAACLYDLTGFEWHDSAWMEQRRGWDAAHSAMNIYEVHLGSWKREGSKKDGLGHAGSVDGTAGRPLTYRESAEQLIPYVKEMGYTHIELLPVMEHPLDMSWGYQVSGYFAATSRYGEPKDLMDFIDRCHQAGIGVLLDWVPAHFPRDEAGLRQFDGTCCYEHVNPLRSDMPQWGTCMFDMARGEVRSFLSSSACFWLEWFHADGIRVDAVSSILYHDFCREPGQWLPNKNGGHENIEGISFLQQLTGTVHRDFPGALMIAEESHAFPGVTHSPGEGGLGFDFKWNMGWMNDTLAYIKLDPVYRKWHHDKLTFSLFYAFSENFVLPFSHDEVVHGKGSMLDKQPGDIWKKFAVLRALYGYTMAHPGKKLLFMGGEFGQFIEWRFDDQLDWFLLLYDMHPQLQRCVREMNALYRSRAEFWQQDTGWDGFQWVQADDRDNSVLAFLRWDHDGNAILCVTNFTPVYHPVYRIGLPAEGTLEELLNTDRNVYGGSDQHNEGVLHTEPGQWHSFEHSLDIQVPPLATVWFTYRRDAQTEEKKAESEAKAEAETPRQAAGAADKA